MFLIIVIVLIIIYFVIKSTNAKCKSKVCLIGKTALITGGNSGLGLETARSLASRGCKVIIADKDDATLTVKNLIKETHNQRIYYIPVDFASFKSVRNFAKVVNTTVERLDILVNNAGIGDPSYVLTQDGVQKIMQVNYLSHFLLVHLLADLLRRSAPSRILYTSSLAAYVRPSLSLTNLKGEPVEDTPLISTGTYGNSKLAGAIASRIFAEKFREFGVTSNCYHPGFVRTQIFKNSFKTIEGVRTFLSVGLVAMITGIIGKTAEEGAQTMLHLAMANEVKTTTGKFYFDLYSFPQPVQLKDRAFCQKIWQLSEEIVGLKNEEKLDFVLGFHRKK